MFRKLVAIEPIRLDAQSEERLKVYAEETVFYPDLPGEDAEVIRRIGDADGVLLSYTSAISGAVLRACPNLRYVGMCCSLYAPESANVDIPAARELGIRVTGVRDYGDPGVREYVVSELVRFLHGFGGPMWREEPLELTGLPVGVLGMGTTGSLVAEALSFFGARVSYFSRTRKPVAEARLGIAYRELDRLLGEVDILICCLNKNVLLLGERELGLLGDGKLILNISIGPGHDVEAMRRWLDRPCQPGNYLFGDTAAAIDPSGGLLDHPHVVCAGRSAGASTLTRRRLGEKVIGNIETFLAERR